MFNNLKPGDIVTRWLAGKIPINLVVKDVGPDRIVCGLPPKAKRMLNLPEPDWEFDPATGVEIDDELQWGPAYGRTGSFLALPLRKRS